MFVCVRRLKATVSTNDYEADLQYLKKQHGKRCRQMQILGLETKKLVDSPISGALVILHMLRIDTVAHTSLEPSHVYLKDTCRIPPVPTGKQFARSSRDTFTIGILLTNYHYKSS